MCAFSGRTGSEARGGSDDVAGVFSDHAASECQTSHKNSGMEKAEANVSALLKELQDAGLASSPAVKSLAISQL